MKKFQYPPAPLMLAYILGPMLEKAIRQTLIVSGGSPLIFLTRPICLTLLGVAFLMTFSPILKRLIKRR
jgi:putative tricarboxylic transport membrane protein